MNITDFLLSNKFGISELYDENMDYDGSGRILYTAFAPRGSSDAAGNWLIFKFTYDGSGRITAVKTSPRNSVWNDRATLF